MSRSLDSRFEPLLPLPGVGGAHEPLKPLRLCAQHSHPVLAANGQANRTFQLRGEAAIFDPWYRRLHPELTSS
jgi:hypothetical protein